MTKKKILNYKGHTSNINYSKEDDLFFGKIEGINDLVIFEGKCVTTLREAFHEAVNDHLETKQELNSIKK